MAHASGVGSETARRRRWDAAKWSAETAPNITPEVRRLLQTIASAGGRAAQERMTPEERSDRLVELRERGGRCFLILPASKSFIVPARAMQRNESPTVTFRCGRQPAGVRAVPAASSSQRGLGRVGADRGLALWERISALVIALPGGCRGCTSAPHSRLQGSARPCDVGPCF